MNISFEGKVALLRALDPGLALQRRRLLPSRGLRLRWPTRTERPYALMPMNCPATGTRHSRYSALQGSSRQLSSLGAEPCNEMAHPTRFECVAFAFGEQTPKPPIPEHRI
jgi:hypothetical protein